MMERHFFRRGWRFAANIFYRGNEKRRSVKLTIVSARSGQGGQALERRRVCFYGFV